MRLLATLERFPPDGLRGQPQRGQPREHGSSAREQASAEEHPLLVVVYTYREPDVIRSISAWRANRPQRVRYEKDHR